MPLLGGIPSEFLDETYPAKTRGVGLLYGENYMILTSTVFWTDPPVWTDRRTDKDGFAIAYSVLSMLSRTKNRLFCWILYCICIMFLWIIFMTVWWDYSAVCTVMWCHGYDTGLRYVNGLRYDTSLRYDTGLRYDNGLRYVSGLRYDTSLRYYTGLRYDNGLRSSCSNQVAWPCNNSHRFVVTCFVSMQCNFSH